MQMLLNKVIKTAALFLAVMLVGAGSVVAQVTVDLNDITGRPGETATIAVGLTGVEAGAAIQSFDFTVATGAGVTFTGHSTGSSLSGDAGFNVNSNPANGAVGGFSTGTNITSSGDLVYLTFSLDTNGATGSVTLNGFTFNAGDPAVAGALTAGYTVSSRIISVANTSVGVTGDFDIVINLEDALTAADGVVSFDLELNYDPSLMTIKTSAGNNGIVASGLSASGTVNGTAVDANTYRAAGFFGSAVEGSGEFIRIAATAGATGGSAVLSLTNVVFNAGSPVYAAKTGTLTVVPVNFAPEFTSALADVSVLEDGADLSFDYDATDANGDAITYSLDGPGSIDAATGEWTLDPSGKAGTHTVTVSASDGVNTTSTSATVTVKQVDLFSANLAGFNEVPPTQTVASGSVTMRMVADDGVLEVTFNVSNLSSTMSGAHIHLGSVGQTGGVSVNLAPTGESFTKTYDISGNAAVVTALRNGGAYVNVHTLAYPAGEVRGQVLSAGNAAPGGATSIAPATVNVQGDPGNTSFSIAWLPVADPDGDAVNYLLQIATDAAFTRIASLTNFGVSNGTAYTVGGAATLYDALTDATPGNVNVGGTVTFYHRVITTDGSLWKAGSSASTTLTRGTVTDTETDSALPTEFALKGNYPNPFNPTTTISFDLPETADVTVQILDLLGREVLAIPSQTMSAGAGQTVQVNASNLSSGIYLYRVIARGASTTNMQVKTMTLLK